MSAIESRLSKLEQRSGVNVPHECIEELVFPEIDHIAMVVTGEHVEVFPCKECGREGRYLGYTPYAEPRPWRPESKEVI